MKQSTVRAQVGENAVLKKRAVSVSIQQQPSNAMCANVGLTPKELRWIRRIQEALSFDLLSKPLKKCVKPEMHYTRGHCYVATEATYHLFAREAGFKPYFVRCPDGGTHWWLVHPSRNVVIDATEPQLDRAVAGYFDYSCSPKYFRHPSPSSRTVVLMIRVLLMPARRNSELKRELLRDLQKNSE